MEVAVTPHWIRGTVTAVVIHWEHCFVRFCCLPPPVILLVPANMSTALNPDTVSSVPVARNLSTPMNNHPTSRDQLALPTRLEDSAPSPSKPSPTRQLPLDVVGNIYNWLEDDWVSKTVLAHASHAFFNEGEFWRWRKVHFEVTADSKTHMIVRRLDMLFSIPDRVTRVVKFSLALRSILKEEHDRHVEKLVHQLLLKTTHLRVLQFCDYIPTPDASLMHSRITARLLPYLQQKFTELEQLIVIVPSSAVPGLWPFVASQTNLRRLVVRTQNPPPQEEILSESLTKLNVAVAPVQFLEVVGQERPLEHIAINVVPDSDAIFALPPSRATIRSISLAAPPQATIRNRLSALTSLAPHARFLTCLLTGKKYSPSSSLSPLMELTSLEIVKWRFKYPWKFDDQAIRQQWSPQSYASLSTRLVIHESLVGLSSSDREWKPIGLWWKSSSAHGEWHYAARMTSEFELHYPRIHLEDLDANTMDFINTYSMW
ncbi:hypothetical protein DL93DRAFT_918152 [Clavulina sp. PMI_390]|nr:hypothetical protein DL93DRAFT_918152 [Clavulina sp. PMI_390]